MINKGGSDFIWNTSVRYISTSPPSSYTVLIPSSYISSLAFSTISHLFSLYSSLFLHPQLFIPHFLFLCPLFLSHHLLHVQYMYLTSLCVFVWIYIRLHEWQCVVVTVNLVFLINICIFGPWCLFLCHLCWGRICTSYFWVISQGGAAGWERSAAVVDVSVVDSYFVLVVVQDDLELWVGSWWEVFNRSTFLLFWESRTQQQCIGNLKVCCFWLFPPWSAFGQGCMILKKKIMWWFVPRDLLSCLAIRKQVCHCTVYVNFRKFVFLALCVLQKSSDINLELSENHVQLRIYQIQGMTLLFVCFLLLCLFSWYVQVLVVCRSYSENIWGFCVVLWENDAGDL